MQYLLEFSIFNIRTSIDYDMSSLLWICFYTFLFFLLFVSAMIDVFIILIINVSTDRVLKDLAKNHWPPIAYWVQVAYQVHTLRYATASKTSGSSVSVYHESSTYNFTHTQMVANHHKQRQHLDYSIINNMNLFQFVHSQRITSCKAILLSPIYITDI